MMPKVRRKEELVGIRTQYYEFHCPGCGRLHVYEYPRWSFNGSMDSPTFTPSLLNQWGKHVDPNWQEPVEPAPSNGWSGTCHLYVTNGQIQYLPDCTHHLAGKTVDMIDL